MADSSQQNVIKMELNDYSALQLVRQLATDSRRVVITTHASKRMLERQITLGQVFKCLRNGSIVESPHRTTKGDWKMTLSGKFSGDAVTVAVVLTNDGQGNQALVITVF